MKHSHVHLSHKELEIISKAVWERVEDLWGKGHGVYRDAEVYSMLVEESEELFSLNRKINKAINWLDKENDNDIK